MNTATYENGVAMFHSKGKLVCTWVVGQATFKILKKRWETLS